MKIMKASSSVFLIFSYQILQCEEHISCSSVGAVPSLNIRQFLLNFLPHAIQYDDKEHFASMADESNCSVVTTVFGVALLEKHNKLLSFPVFWPYAHSPYHQAQIVNCHFTSLWLLTLLSTVAQALLHIDCLVIQKGHCHIHATCLETSYSIKVLPFLSFMLHWL